MTLARSRASSVAGKLHRSQSTTTDVGSAPVLQDGSRLPTPPSLPLRRRRARRNRHRQTRHRSGTRHRDRTRRSGWTRCSGWTWTRCRGWTRCSGCIGFLRTTTAPSLDPQESLQSRRRHAPELPGLDAIQLPRPQPFVHRGRSHAQRNGDLFGREVHRQIRFRVLHRSPYNKACETP